MKTLLVGDTHANTGWLTGHVFPAAKEHKVDNIIQLGDFGWWPRQAWGKRFIEAALKSPFPLCFIDGNHEDHKDLLEFAEPDESIVFLGGDLWWLRRGARLTQEGVSILACGGARSIDRADRIPDFSWFAEEEISSIDEENCISGGHADILLCHDAPDNWHIPGTDGFAHLPQHWWADLEACKESRRTLSRIYEAIQPSLVAHGHWHNAYMKSVEESWGQVWAIGLNRDSCKYNMAILHCNDGEFICQPLET